MRIVALAALILVSAAPAVAENFDAYKLDEPLRELNLPQALIEVSGLAAASDRSVYAHNDEFAIVYEIGLENGDIIAAFALGDPSAQGDFEGIAAEEERIYLVTSTGLLYEAPIGKHGERVHFNVYDLGLSDRCEVEGLSNGPAPHEFLVLCKTPRSKELNNHLSIFKWNLDERLPVTEPWLSLPLGALLNVQEKKLFRPSGIEWRAKDRTLIVVSARNQMIVTLSENGKLISKAGLNARDHLQTEGVTLLANGQLVLSDEGGGRRYGRLTIYDRD